MDDLGFHQIQGNREAQGPGMESSPCSCLRVGGGGGGAPYLSREWLGDLWQEEAAPLEGFSPLGPEFCRKSSSNSDAFPFLSGRWHFSMAGLLYKAQGRNPECPVLAQPIQNPLLVGGQSTLLQFVLFKAVSVPPCGSLGPWACSEGLRL